MPDLGADDPGFRPEFFDDMAHHLLRRRNLNVIILHAHILYPVVSHLQNVVLWPVDNYLETANLAGRKDPLGSLAITVMRVKVLERKRVERESAVG